jgi:hypothetical protein
MVLQLDKWVIAFVIFGVIIAGGLLITVDIEKTYDVTINDSAHGSWNELTGLINETYGISTDMSGKATGEDVEDTGMLESLLRGSYLALKQVKNTFSMFTSVIEIIALELGIPAFFLTAAMAVMTIAVIFALIYLFMRII